MIRKMAMLAAMLLLAGCGKVVELANQTRTVAAPREAVFEKMFGDAGEFTGLPLVSNGGSSRTYELVVQKGDREWPMIAPKQRPDAYQVKIMVQMEIPSETHMVYSIDEGAVVAGLKFNLEELAPDRTKVSFSIDELSGTDTAGLEVNSGAVTKIARSALKKLDSFNKVDEPS